MGVDDKSGNIYHIYWLLKWIITIEHNIYWNPMQCDIEGEEERTYPSDATLAYVNNPQPSATIAKSGLSMPQPQATGTLHILVFDPITTFCLKSTHQPSQCMPDIINSKALNPTSPQGVQLPDPVAENPKPDSSPAMFEGEGTANQILATVAYDDDVKLILKLNETIAEAEALKPTSLSEAQQCLDWPQWEHGIHKELTMLKKTNTWDLVEPPVDANIIGSKWIFHVKKDAARNIVRHKACLVTQGFLQVPSIDYFDTYTLVAKLTSICTVLTLATHLNLELHQIDIKGAYLNSELNDDEAIHMHQLPSYANPAHPCYICWLCKMLCGLKQSSHQWYQKLVEILIRNLRFKQCEVDQAVFIK